MHIVWMSVDCTLSVTEQPLTQTHTHTHCTYNLCTGGNHYEYIHTPYIYIHIYTPYVLCIHELHGCGDRVDTIIYYIYTHALDTSKFVLYTYVCVRVLIQLLSHDENILYTCRYVLNDMCSALELHMYNYTCTLQ